LIARIAARSTAPARRSRWAALLPLLVMADLLGAHWREVPTVEPRYWTEAPESARRLKADPSLIRIFARGDKHSGEPGYASEEEPIDFLTVRDPLDWSLPPVWHVPTSRGNTPMISRRLEAYARLTEKHPWRHDLESDSHIVTGRNLNPAYRYLPAEPVGTAFIHRNRGALPRARLVGHPVYADDFLKAAESVFRLGESLRNRVVVEDPTRPLPDDATVSGTAQIVEDLPEKVVVETDARMPAYLVLSDTFDPGWSARIDNRPAPIRPAYLAFRAVYLPEGSHTVVFTYRPAGFVMGLALTGCGIVLGLVLWLLPRLSLKLASEHALLGWPSWWRTGWFLALGAIVLVSTVTIGPGWRIALQDRWKDSVHTHTWGAGLLAQKGYRM
jgi:hypothetical protein